MKKYGLNELREMFLSFFESKGHLRLPSFSLIPKNDKSLLLINSGMAPMKPWFTGEQEPPRKRVCTCQKCIRTGDIENIGHTARHATYFEMLGNFSFGDYFKKEAIEWCWEFLTQVLGLDPDRLYPSVYYEDDEAFEIWEKVIGIAPERIFRFGRESNFWDHGSGPCGPCSEVYYDRGPKYGCGEPDCTVGCDCDRYVEVWNNVFSQFNNDGNNNYTELVQKNIDTGMGLERLAMVCQDVDSIFDVDTVMSITNKVSEITGVTYGQSREKDVSLRVITDHIRSATMMICDGVLPSNEGRGYVLRRLLRRAARHGRLLGTNEPFLSEVAATVIAENAQPYPDLVEKKDYIMRVIKLEEENFAKTIDGGMRILNDLISEHVAKGENLFSGSDAFRLYDTYGFPIDLTVEIVEEAGLKVDRDAFDQLMEQQRERARAARAAMGDLAWASSDLGLDLMPTQFTGYEKFEDTGKILAIISDGELCSSVREGIEAILVLDKTPFYAEAGGQVADTGKIFAGNNIFEVNSVHKDSGDKYYLHHGKMLSGTLSVDDAVTASIDADRRRAIMRAHSCTHLLHKALRTVLGTHVEQAGSLVTPDSIRFDFTHFSALTPEEIEKIDSIVNDAILAGMDITITETGLEKAKEMGAMALFGEKYGDTVCVVKMGDFSIELCGGTHLDNTAKVGCYHTVSEFSVASGVRRIEAVVGKGVLALLSQANSLINQVAATLKSNPAELAQKAEQLVHEQRESRRLIEKLRSGQLRADAERLFSEANAIGGLKVVAGRVSNATVDDLRTMGDFLRDKDENIVAVLAAVNNGKITFLATCGKNAIARDIKAGNLIKHVTALTGGSGGGKPDTAMGGGKVERQLDKAFGAVYDYITENVKG
ncbi:MAG: alanine--tRNA ligase [Oscillospiraceae bacterium]|jgi:alanyl-tRNA synthetase